MDYKSTLNLPKTTFPMRGNLSQTEPAVLERWEKDQLYRQIQTLRKAAAPFILHDGPPYANGDIHIGHALNKTLKDFIVRFQAMRGKRSPYVPGWDCHGLPIEYALMKEMKVSKHQVNVADFRRKARAYAMKYVGVQRDQFKRLGVLGDWEQPYLTLAPGYVTAALKVLATLTEKGFVYRARKPVNWCWSCETALAEAEVEYEKHTSPSIYVKFELTPESSCKLAGIAGGKMQAKRFYLVIWTTTPWTLMGNVAVAVHPNFKYGVWQKKGSDEAWVLLSNPPAGARSMLAARGLNGPENLAAEIDGKKLEGLLYNHPFGLRQGKVVLADYVSMEDGTGLVHTAPGFGAEDFATGRKYGLDIIAPVDAQGKFAGLPKEAAEFNGQQVQSANPAVNKKLQALGALLKEAAIEHDYPHCWRCRNPIIFRATDQWFLKIDHTGLREKLLSVIEKEVKWIPAEGEERIAGMVKLRPDWCLSRQRLWGIPIPAVICTGCGEGTLDPRIILNFTQAIETDPEGSDKWFTEAVTRWLPAGFKCPNSTCGGTSFERGTDILDVWFDSGVSHQAVLRQREGLVWPADMYLEGSDQHRGWFQVSLITSTALNGKAPYKSVLTHGFVVDGEGRKMSKSLGNVIAPQQVIAQFGADVLRLWVASSDYREDIRISKEILTQVADLYRKIRNTVRFCLSNISDFSPADRVPLQRMEEIDRWALSRLSALIEEVTGSYESCTFHKVIQTVHEFCTVEMSNFYLDVLKDRLYTSRPAGAKRRSAQTALAEIARALITLTAPILPMTASEAWAAYLPDSTESVHTAEWPVMEAAARDPKLEEVWARLFRLRDEAMKALEKARQEGTIGDSLEAELEIVSRDEAAQNFLSSRQESFAAACIVSSLIVKRGSGSGEPFVFSVRRAPGEKCQRCWMRLPTVGGSAEHPTLCHRCVENISYPASPLGKL